MPLEDFLPLQVYAMLIVLARLGALVFLLPGIGETYIPVRVRILFVLAMTLAIAPVVGGSIPGPPDSAADLFLVVFKEVAIGLFFGIVARALLITLATAGTIISLSTGLSNATVFNPALQDQGTSVSLLLTLLGIMLIFATDMHHLIIRALVQSYAVFPVGATLPIDDFSLAIARLVGDAFEMALQMSAPFIVISLMFFAALGIMSRLMPQLQIFFIGIPIQMLLGFMILIAIIGTMMGVFLEYYELGIAGYLVPR